jgi:hypothetical protein
MAADCTGVPHQSLKRRQMSPELLKTNNDNDKEEYFQKTRSACADHCMGSHLPYANHVH